MGCNSIAVGDRSDTHGLFNIISPTLKESVGEKPSRLCHFPCGKPLAFRDSLYILEASPHPRWMRQSLRSKRSRSESRRLSARKSGIAATFHQPRFLL